MSNQEGIFSSLADSWPSAFVSRGEISRFSGGIINPRTLANQDSQGVGPKGRINIGRKVCYPVSSVIAWLEERAVQAVGG